MGQLDDVILNSNSSYVNATITFIEAFARAAERTDFKVYEAEKVEFTRSK